MLGGRTVAWAVAVIVWEGVLQGSRAADMVSRTLLVLRV